VEAEAQSGNPAVGLSELYASRCSMRKLFFLLLFLGAACVLGGCNGRRDNGYGALQAEKKGRKPLHHFSLDE